MLRIAGKEPMSIVDGPGFRYALFLQGCNHHCKGCHNPATWNKCGGETVAIEVVLEDIYNTKYIDGVTISGGEPLDQSENLLKLLKNLKERGFHVILYTGYTFEEVVIDEMKNKCLSYIDIMVDGEYKEELRSLEIRFRGSKNQRVIDVQNTLKFNKLVYVNW